MRVPIEPRLTQEAFGASIFDPFCSILDLQWDSSRLQTRYSGNWQLSSRFLPYSFVQYARKDSPVSASARIVEDIEAIITGRKRFQRFRVSVEDQGFRGVRGSRAVVDV